MGEDSSGGVGRMKGRRIRMKRTLITGGAGFLGSHLCDFFMDLGMKSSAWIT
jgi:FlaA1/EpsC-like NDP-sugar epimerase